jgi:hypothetical protein
MDHSPYAASNAASPGGDQPEQTEIDGKGDGEQAPSARIAADDEKDGHRDAMHAMAVEVAEDPFAKGDGHYPVRR